MYTDKYCRECGQKNKKTNLNSFNHKTGKSNTALICPNETCSEHCCFFDKHKWGSFWEMQHEICQICGYCVLNY